MFVSVLLVPSLTSFRSVPPSIHQDAAVLPAKRHRVVGKKSGQTSHIELTNNTLCQRLSRLVRKTVSFSEKPANHDGAIW